MSHESASASQRPLHRFVIVTVVTFAGNVASLLAAHVNAHGTTTAASSLLWVDRARIGPQPLAVVGVTWRKHDRWSWR